MVQLYYKVLLTLLQSRVPSRCYKVEHVIYYKVGPSLLQSKAGTKSWQILQSGAVITK